MTKEFKVITYIDASDSVDESELEDFLQEAVHVYQNELEAMDYLQSIRITGIEAKINE